MQELLPGLHRWTAPHPDWRPGDDWAEQVGCVLYNARQVVTVVDPLVPDGLWPTLDALVGDRPVAVLTTIEWHARSAAAVAARYPAAHPVGVEPVEIPRSGELMAWIPDLGALVTGDCLIGDDAGGLRVCPPSWIETLPYDELREELRVLLELPVEAVLVSHGEPVLTGGREAIARALA